MRILFYGDSVTDCGRDYNDDCSLGKGYVKYTVESIRTAFEEDANIEFINKGISGNRTIDLLNRLEKDVISYNPDVITILIGVNDTWRRYDNNDPTSAEQFRENYESVLTQIKSKTNAKIIMLEPFLIYGMGRDNYREDLNEKIDVVRMLAKKYADFYIPLDGLLASAAVEYNDVSVISADGVHPAEEGKKIISWHLLQVLCDVIEELMANENDEEDN